RPPHPHPPLRPPPPPPPPQTTPRRPPPPPQKPPPLRRTPPLTPPSADSAPLATSKPFTSFVGADRVPFGRCSPSTNQRTYEEENRPQTLPLLCLATHLVSPAARCRMLQLREWIERLTGPAPPAPSQSTSPQAKTFPP